MTSDNNGYVGTHRPGAESFTTFDIGAVAEDFGKTPVPFVDDRLVDDNGKLVDLEGNTVAREHAARLSAAANHGVTQRAQGTAGRHAATADALHAELDHRAMAEVEIGKRLTQASTLELRLHAVPDSALPRGAKVLSLAAKPLLAGGDLALLAMKWYEGGAAIYMAILSALSVATGAVFAGTVAGRSARVNYQRHSRGPLPPNAPGDVADLYDTADPSARGKARLWVLAAALFALGLGGAVYGICAANNAGTTEAFSTGVLAALTVAGSAFAEAYGTNAALERIRAQVERRREACRDLEVLAERHGQEHWHRTSAHAALAAGYHEAVAAEQTTFVVADPSKHDPRTFGYESPMPADAALAAITALPEPVAFPTHATPTAGDDAKTAETLAAQLDAFARVAVPGVDAAGPEPVPATAAPPERHEEDTIPVEPPHPNGKTALVGDGN